MLLNDTKIEQENRGSEGSVSAARQMGCTDPLITEGTAGRQEPCTGQGQKHSTGSPGEAPSVKNFKSKEEKLKGNKKVSINRQ